MAKLDRKKYEVHVRMDSNDLNGMVQVVSVSKMAAERFAVKQFFPGWKVVSSRRMSEDSSPNENVPAQYREV